MTFKREDFTVRMIVPKKIEPGGTRKTQAGKENYHEESYTKFRPEPAFKGKISFTKLSIPSIGSVNFLQTVRRTSAAFTKIYVVA